MSRIFCSRVMGASGTIVHERVGGTPAVQIQKQKAATDQNTVRSGQQFKQTPTPEKLRSDIPAIHATLPATKLPRTPILPRSIGKVSPAIKIRPRNRRISPTASPRTHSAGVNAIHINVHIPASDIIHFHRATAALAGRLGSSPLRIVVRPRSLDIRVSPTSAARLRRSLNQS